MVKPSRPMPLKTRARLGGLTRVVKGPPMADAGRQGATALDRRIAAEAGIPDGLPQDQYLARLAAARSAYYVRLAERRWGKGA